MPPKRSKSLSKTLRKKPTPFNISINTRTKFNNLTNSNTNSVKIAIVENVAEVDHSMQTGLLTLLSLIAFKEIEYTGITHICVAFAASYLSTGVDPVLRKRNYAYRKYKPQSFEIINDEIELHYSSYELTNWSIAKQQGILEYATETSTEWTEILDPDNGWYIMCVLAICMCKMANPSDEAAASVVLRAERVLDKHKGNISSIDLDTLVDVFFAETKKEPYYKEIIIAFGMALNSSDANSANMARFAGLFAGCYGAGQTMLKWGSMTYGLGIPFLALPEVLAESSSVNEIYKLYNNQNDEIGFAGIRGSSKATVLSFTDCPNFSSVVLGAMAALGNTEKYAGKPKNPELYELTKEYVEKLKEKNRDDIRKLLDEMENTDDFGQEEDDRESGVGDEEEEDDNNSNDDDEY